MSRYRLIAVFGAAVILALITTPTPATEDDPASWYVSPTGNDSATGRIGDPFATIQRAIDAAADGEIVKLHAGTYTGDGNRDIHTRSKQLMIISLSGNPAACVIDCQGTAAEPHIGFIISGELWEFTEVTLGGLTIRNAWTDATRQGAVYVAGTSQESQDGIGPSDGGGGIAVLQHLVIAGTRGTGVTVLGEGAGAFIQSCRINDSSRFGIYQRGMWPRVWIWSSKILRSGSHGILQRGAHSPGVSVVLSEISGNGGAGVWASAMWGGTDDHTEIYSCDIRHNGAAGVIADGPLIMVLTTVAENGGGGLIPPARGCDDWWLNANRILDNDGDGIRMTTYTYVEHNLRGNEIRGNRGHGLVVTVEGEVQVLWDCLITGNKGHGVVLELTGADSGGLLTGSTVAGNGGAGIFVADGSERPVSFEGSIVAFNRGAALGEAKPDPGGAPALMKALAVGEVTCTDIHGNGSDWTGPLAPFEGVDGNLDADPQFCDEVGYDLAVSSPCAAENNAACGQIGARAVGCFGVPDAVAAANGAPAAARIVGAHPNPFNPVTTLVFELPARGVVDLAVYDLRGRLVRRLVSAEVRGPGRQEVVWRGRDERGRLVATGVYVWRVEAAGALMTDRITLLK